MPGAEPLAPARKSVRPAPGDSLAAIAARELPGTPAEEALGQLKAWNPHLGFGRRAYSYVLVSDVIFIEPPREQTSQGGF